MVYTEVKSCVDDLNTGFYGFDKLELTSADTFLGHANFSYGSTYVAVRIVYNLAQCLIQMCKASFDLNGDITTLLAEQLGGPYFCNAFKD